MADTAVALASANVQVVSRKVIGRLDTVRRHPLVIDRSVYSPDLLASLSNISSSEIRLSSLFFLESVVIEFSTVVFAQLISKTFISPTLRLEAHLMWDDIAILTRYLLMLSFNDCLDGKIFSNCMTLGRFSIPFEWAGRNY